eukprot:gene11156-14967_t
MSFYGPPPNVPLSEALHLIFSHYVSPWKSSSAIGNDNIAESTGLWMDGASFSRMCKEAPDLVKYIGRTDIDLIFSRTKPIGVRRLDFDHFLDTLLELAVRIFPDDDPIIALANFLAKFIFALFDQPPVEDGVAVIQNIIEELTLKQKS